MQTLKAGKLDATKLANDNLVSPSTFSGKNIEAFGRYNMAVLHASPLKEIKESKPRDMPYKPVNLQNTWE